MPVKKKQTKKAQGTVKEKLVRNRRISITLNDRELRVIERFYKEYKIRNKTKFLRDTIIKTVWSKLEESSPTLFSEQEMK